MSLLPVKDRRGSEKARSLAQGRQEDEGSAGQRGWVADGDSLFAHLAVQDNLVRSFV